MKYVDVAVGISSIEKLTYSVPHELIGHVEVGKRVLVPLGKRKVTGYIVAGWEVSDRQGVRDIIEVLDLNPLFTEADLAFYMWVSVYYMYPLGKALKSILPGGIDAESGLWLSLSPQWKGSHEKALSEREIRIAKMLEDYPAGLSIKQVRDRIPNRHLRNDITKLQGIGVLNVEDRLKEPAIKVRKETIIRKTGKSLSGIKLTEKQKNVYDLLASEREVPLSLLREKFKNPRPVIKSMEKKGLLHVSERERYRRPAREDNLCSGRGAVTLTDEQAIALAKIVEGVSSNKYSPYLLHGVTGSGKTEVYLRAMEKVIAMGGSVLYLVPEISLTPQLVSRINERFDESIIAILHSGISRVSKYDEWRRIQRGDARIIAGARSAIFSPVRNLRLIIIDEEHDGSYKQDDHMTYNARDIAVVRAKMTTSTVVLGSATPAVRTYFNTQEKGFVYLELTKRVEDRSMPAFDIIDMKYEKGEKGNFSILSRPLKKAIADTLSDGKQTLLFLNRRGFNTFICCMDCGHVFKCLNCSISLTHHSGEGALRCHYCNFTIKSPPICSSCRGSNVKSYGVGTERLEDEIKRLFPTARVERMDSDSTAKRGSHGRILRSFDRRETDILIGTQMVTKGHDYPNVTLVGVVSADSSLNIPDFRASERTFQLLTQVAGRGGRGDLPGRVIVQTFNPEHYAITLARSYNYKEFYKEEVNNRRQLGYPPFSRMINLRISSPQEERTKNFASRIGEVARSESAKYGVDIMGPAEAPIAKIKGRYRWHMLLKGLHGGKLRAFTTALLERTKRSDPDIKVDIDPVNFM
ncbi:MAG: primosomal protein N' [Deltaproteobacteria bacterium]|nr:primosomal protein N' [Deltaproteobacteria bacterium]